MSNWMTPLGDQVQANASWLVFSLGVLICLLCSGLNMCLRTALLTSPRPDHKVKAAASATKSKWPLQAVIASILFSPLCAGRWKSCADLVFTRFNEGVRTGEGRRAAFYVLPPVGGGVQSKVAEVDAKELAGAGGERQEGLNEAVTTAVQHFRPAEEPFLSSNLSVFALFCFFFLLLSLLKSLFLLLSEPPGYSGLNKKSSPEIEEKNPSIRINNWKPKGRHQRDFLRIEKMKCDSPADGSVSRRIRRLRRIERRESFARRLWLSHQRWNKNPTEWDSVGSSYYG